MRDAATSKDPNFAAAVYWQRLAGQGLLHPLSCRTSAGHRPLEPRADERGETTLVCVDCGYTTLVPEPILRIWQALTRQENEAGRNMDRVGERVRPGGRQAVADRE